MSRLGEESIILTAILVMVPCLIILQVEQLCEQAGEESIILTATLSDSSLPHYLAG